MKRVLLVSGMPKAGKSFLADALETRHSFQRLSVDDAYVEFIRSDCPMLYFEALGRYILPHYQLILGCRDYSMAQFDRDFVAEWHLHLLDEIQRLTSQAENVVAEGFLLGDCGDELAAGLRNLAEVFSLVVENRRYVWQHRLLTIDQVAALGMHTTSERS